MQLKCEYCNKSFERDWKNPNKRVFCSKKCLNTWQIGKHNSQSTEFKKGCKINLGKKRSPEICAKFSKVQKRRWQWDTPWNKGKSLPQEMKEKIRQTLLGRKLPEEQKIKIKNSMKGKNRGPNNPMWKGGVKVFGKYVCIITDDGKHITEHRYIMEKYLKRPLKPNEVVHHKNRLRHDNRIENLEVMDAKEHSRYHTMQHHNLNKAGDKYGRK